MSMLSTLFSGVFLFLRVVALVVAAVAIKPMAPKALVSGGLLVLLLNSLAAKIVFGTELVNTIYELSYNLGQVLNLSFSLMELLGYFILLVGLVFMKPAPRG